MATPNAIRMMNDMAAADSANQAAVLRAANELGDEIVGRVHANGRDCPPSLGEFTLVMHGLHVPDFNQNAMGGSNPEVQGALSADASRLVDRYVELERRFNGTIGRYDERPVAALEHSEERYGDTDNKQIAEIAVAPTTFGERSGQGENSLQYRIRRIRRPIDDEAPTATQHGYEGTLELPVRHLQAFDDMLGLSEPEDTRVVLARLVRTRASLVIHGEEDFFDDRYFIGMPEIMGEREFDSRNGNENAEHDLLFMRRALAAKELAVRAMLERTSRPASHMAIMAAGDGTVSVIPAEV